MTIDHDELVKLLRYEPDTGNLYWRVDKGGIKAGTQAGCINKSHRATYRLVRVNKKLYLAHRLAWLYHYGEWPSLYLDHIDGDGLNNRISNLRDVTNAQNIQATLKKPKHNTSGFKGVIRYKNKWKASISIDNKKVHIGVFDTPEKAHMAYLKKKSEVHFQ